MNASRLKEREDAIVGGILSGNNCCGTLAAAAAKADAEYFRAAMRPTLEIYESEADFSARQRDAILRDAETRRQALEFVVANLPLSAAAAHVVGRALGREIKVLPSPQ